MCRVSLLKWNRTPTGNPMPNHIITLDSIFPPISILFTTRTTIPFTIPIHSTMVVIIVTTAIITTLTTILIIMVVLEAEGCRVAAGEEDPRVVAAEEDVEDLDRIRDPLGGEFEPRVPIKQGSTAGSEMTLPF